MKQFFIFFIFLCCEISAQNWVQLNDIGSPTSSINICPPTKNAVCLSMNGKIYIIGAETFSCSMSVAKLWEYDDTNDSWEEKSTYPGTNAVGLSGFSIGDYGYIGGGNSSTDFYKYNTNTNSWSTISNIPVARRDAVGFSINEKGYICCGDGNVMGTGLNDLWQYDTTLNNWTQKANFPGNARYAASGFSSGGYGFVGLGYGSGNWFSDFYKYNPSTDNWTLTSSFPGLGRSGAGGLSLNGNGFIFCGNNAMAVLNDCYRYNITTNTWSGFTTFAGLNRSSIIYGAIDNHIYIGGGSGSGGSANYKDWWTIENTVDIKNNIETQNLVYIYKNSENDLILKFKNNPVEPFNYSILNLTGKIVYEGIVISNSTKIPIINAGVYFIHFDKKGINPIRLVKD